MQWRLSRGATVYSVIAQEIEEYIKSRLLK